MEYFLYRDYIFQNTAFEDQGVMNRPKVQRRVGKYEVGKTLGQGTFAKVRCAVNTETGERVALKILDKEKVLKHKMAEQVNSLS